MGVTTTLHHFGVPVAAGPKALKRATFPVAASRIAVFTTERLSTGHRSTQAVPRIAPKSSISMAHKPGPFTSSSRPSRSVIVIQSALASKTLRESASLRRKNISASFRSFMSASVPCHRTGFPCPFNIGFARNWVHIYLPQAPLNRSSHAKLLPLALASRQLLSARLKSSGCARRRHPRSRLRSTGCPVRTAQ